MNQLIENAKKISDSAKITTMKATEKVLIQASKAVDGANSIADNVSEKVESVVNSKDNTEEGNEKFSKDKKVNLDVLLQTSIDEYNQAFTELNDTGTALYVERERSLDLIIHIENLINSIANHPKSFDTDIETIRMYREEFQEVCDFAKSELVAAKKSVMSAGSGVAAGAAVASVAPTAAIWIASTFGTASTGTAISSLSGAAATNAALAWIGGGTLATGGGGIASGTAFLALAGPIGWSIAGATIFASVALFRKQKMKTNKEKSDEIEKVKINTESVRESALKIEAVLIKTKQLRSMLNEQYNNNLVQFGRYFLDIPEVEQIALGALVNNTMSLAKTLGETL